jgi:PAS domain S-box-containing protein
MSELRQPTNEVICESIARVQALYEHVLIMLQVVDEAGKSLVAVSDQWLQVLGYRRSEVLGRASTDFLTPRSRQLVQTLYLPELFKTHQLHEVTCELVKKNGESFPVLLSAMVERHEMEGGARWFMVLTDPKTQQQPEPILAALAQTVARVGETDFFQSLVRHLTATLQVRHAFVTECVNRAMTRVRTLAYIKQQELVENIEYDLAGTPCEGVIGGSVCYYPEKLSTFFQADAGLEFYLGAPCYDSQGKLLGHLAVLNEEPLACSAQSVAIIEIFAARAGAELERKRAAEALWHDEGALSQLNHQLESYNRDLARQVAERTHELEQRRQVAERLRDLLTILNSNRPLDEMLDYILGIATQLLQSPSGAIYALQNDSKMLTIQAMRGLPTAYATAPRIALEQSVLDQAVLKRQPVILSNLVSSVVDQENRLGQGQPAILPAHYRTLLTVPLLRQGEAGMPDKVYGGIALYYTEQRAFTDEEIALVVAFATQAALAIENAQLRQRVEQAAIIAERSRLARELHDSVTQSLYSMTLLTEGWRRLAVADQLECVADHLAELGELSRQSLKELRLLVHELLPPALEKEGLLGALHQRLAAVEQRAGVDARLIATDLIDLPPVVEATLYRIAQEALNNALKYAAATKITVTLRSEAMYIMLEIADNGQGFDPAAVIGGGGYGLISMRERAEKVGGILMLTTAPGSGVCIQVRIDQRSL